MGIIKAFGTSVNGVAKDQWLDYFYCDSIAGDALMLRGTARVGQNSSNHGNDGIISNGSIVCVADGQVAILVNRGKVAEVWSEPGEHRVTGGNPSVFGKSGFSKTMEEVGERFAFGGVARVGQQRVYYFNTKEILDNAFASNASIPFRVVDEVTGLDYDANLVCSGIFTFRIVNPELVYKRLAGNVSDRYQKERLLSQLDAEMCTVLQTALAKLNGGSLRPYNAAKLIPELIPLIREEMNRTLIETRGIELLVLAFSTFHVSVADGRVIQKLQETAVLKDPTMAAAVLTGAQAEAMVTAAENIGTGKVAIVYHFCTECGAPNVGKFCRECGAKRYERTGETGKNEE